MISIEQYEKDMQEYLVYVKNSKENGSEKPQSFIDFKGYEVENYRCDVNKTRFLTTISKDKNI